jgi:hypothetical protein
MNPKMVLNQSYNLNLPTIKCECGYEILLLPDLKAMGQAIEKHALDHKRKYALTQEETDSLENNLIAQALKLASEIKKLMEVDKLRRYGIGKKY